jgi:hypothetical protein
MKDIPAMLRVVTKLEENGNQQAVDVALGGILIVEIIISKQDRSDFSHTLDVLDDGGAYGEHKCPIIETEQKPHTRECSFRHPLQN